MDPNANLDEQLELARRIQRIRDNATPAGTYTEEQRADMLSLAMALADLVENLDHWLTREGFLPERWEHHAEGRKGGLAIVTAGKDR